MKNLLIPENAPQLVTKNITKLFGNVAVLKDVNVMVAPNKITAFIGPNGAGKTTLFHLISGNLKPSSGIIQLNDYDITALPPWKVARCQVGNLFQDARVFKNMTVIENIYVSLLTKDEQSLLSVFLRSARRKCALQRKEEAMYWLKFVDLIKYANYKAGELSFGQQKLLAIARLMAYKAKFLLLDEPTAALSVDMTKKMITLIQKLIANANITIALIEHNMYVVKELASYCYFMHEGEIFYHGSQTSVLENPDVLGRYMGIGNVKTNK